MSLITRNHGVFGCSGLLVAASLFSYHVRELLICWLFLSVPLVLLAVFVLRGVVACNAGQYFVHWAGGRIQVKPVTVQVVGKVELHSPRAVR